MLVVAESDGLGSVWGCLCRCPSCRGMAGEGSWLPVHEAWVRGSPGERGEGPRAASVK